MDKRKWLFLKWHQDQRHVIVLPATVNFLFATSLVGTHGHREGNSGQGARFWHFWQPEW